VVVGKGKLIANTSMADILARSTHSGVLVRTPDIGKLTAALEKRKISFTKDAGGLIIGSVKSDEVGEIAFKAQVRLHELTNHAASLEEAFLELTAGSEEFAGSLKPAKKKAKR
jgi:ABC-2 type transport system ATP-binding protein